MEANPDHDALEPQAIFGLDFAAQGAAAAAWKKEKGIANQGASLVPADAASISPTSILAIERLLLQPVNVPAQVREVFPAKFY